MYITPHPLQDLGFTILTVGFDTPLIYSFALPKLRFIKDLGLEDENRTQSWKFICTKC